MDKDIFGEDQTQTAETPASYKDLYLGEGKKFKDEEALAKGKYESDQFIARLQAEMATLRKELESRTKLDEIADLLRNKTTVDQENVRTTIPEQTQIEQREVKTVDLDRLVDQKLSEREQAQIRERNLAHSREEARKVLGPNYNEHLLSKARELRMSPNQMKDLAERSPDAFLRLVIDKSSQPDVRAPDNSVRTIPSTTMQNTGMKYSDYEKLRKEKPNEYWSPRVQNEIHKKAQQLGAAFYT
jgi:hypothetical protein